MMQVFNFFLLIDVEFDLFSFGYLERMQKDFDRWIFMNIKVVTLGDLFSRLHFEFRVLM